MGFRIKTVSRLTGIPRNTLLAWERRYQLVTPGRSDNGYREYSDEDVQYLQAVKRLVDQGYKISEAITLVDDGGLDTHVGSPGQDGSALGTVQRQLLDALLRFDRSGADDALAQLPLTGFDRLIDAVYMPLLREVGQAWHEGRVSIAQEHFTSEYVRERLLAMLVSLGHGPSTGRLAVCACMSGERHEGGLLAFAVRLALRGHRISWLGADIPAADVGEAARRQNAHMVCISAVARASADKLVTYVGDLRSASPRGCELVVGGAAVAHHQDALPDLDGVTWAASATAFIDDRAQSRQEAAR